MRVWIEKTYDIKENVNRKDIRHKREYEPKNIIVLFKRFLGFIDYLKRCK